MINNILALTHPEYDDNAYDWRKWRLAYEGGRPFIDAYLEKYSIRETTDDFETRKRLTYCPGFAQNAIDDVRNGICHKFVDIVRSNGPQDYQDAVVGLNGGVDLRGMTMNNFMYKVTTELLTMRKVGVWVDMPTLNGRTLRDTAGKRPYLYMYQAEDILSWTDDEPGQPNRFKSILLRDNIYTKDDTTGLVTGLTYRLRYVQKTDSGIKIQFFNSKGEAIDIDNKKADQTYDLELPKFPFTLFEIPTSLMKNIADYQIALLNIESSDVNYTRIANFPIYTEQYDKRVESTHNAPQKEILEAADGTVTEIVNQTPVVEVGPMKGRRYHSGMDRPGFINPSSEPLVASMKKEEQIKTDIRRLVHLVVENFGQKNAQEVDSSNYENGLSNFGIVLEAGEKDIAENWCLYTKEKSAIVKYPNSYKNESDKERNDKANARLETLQKVPSKTFKRETLKQVAVTLLGGLISDSKIKDIFNELDTAKTLNTDPATIVADVEAGLVSSELASIARGYPEGEAEKAKEEVEERQKAILDAQGGEGGQARGVPELQPDKKTSSQEKVGKAQRGEGKMQR